MEICLPSMLELTHKINLGKTAEAGRIEGSIVKR